MVFVIAGDESCDDPPKQRPNPVAGRAIISSLYTASGARHAGQRDHDRSGIWPAASRATYDHCNLHHQRNDLLHFYQIHTVKLDYQRLP